MANLIATELRSLDPYGAFQLKTAKSLSIHLNKTALIDDQSLTVIFQKIQENCPNLSRLNIINDYPIGEDVIYWRYSTVNPDPKDPITRIDSIFKAFSHTIKRLDLRLHFYEEGKESIDFSLLAAGIHNFVNLEVLRIQSLDGGDDGDLEIENGQDGCRIVNNLLECVQHKDRLTSLFLNIYDFIIEDIEYPNREEFERFTNTMRKYTVLKSFYWKCGHCWDSTWAFFNSFFAEHTNIQRLTFDIQNCYFSIKNIHNYLYNNNLKEFQVVQQVDFIGETDISHEDLLQLAKAIKENKNLERLNLLLDVDPGSEIVDVDSAAEGWESRMTSFYELLVAISESSTLTEVSLALEEMYAEENQQILTKFIKHPNIVPLINQKIEQNNSLLRFTVNDISLIDKR